MKSREEAVEFINTLLTAESSKYDFYLEKVKHGKHHFGKQELKLLLDFIYEGPPGNKLQELALLDYRK